MTNNNIFIKTYMQTECLHLDDSIMCIHAQWTRTNIILLYSNCDSWMGLLQFNNIRDYTNSSKQNEYFIQVC